jgi:hypothetical protein
MLTGVSPAVAQRTAWRAKARHEQPPTKIVDPLRKVDVPIIAQAEELHGVNNAAFVQL